jgi:hypothetical protein
MSTAHGRLPFLHDAQTDDGLIDIGCAREGNCYVDAETQTG